MRGHFFFVVLTVLIGTAARAEDSVSQLLVDFDAAVAVIEPRASGGPVQLPGLTFTLRVDALCPAELAPKTISISIADTRINISPDGANDVETSIRVPQNQLGPIAVNDFCITGEDPVPEQPLQLRDALSAQLSLHCSGENRESMHYETVALEVELQCAIPEAALSP